MTKENPSFPKLVRNEALLTFFLWALYLLQAAFDKREPSLSLVDFAFTANYVLASSITNYLLIPRFFYKGRYWQFLILLLVVIFAGMLVEELVLEAIFYPGTHIADFFNPVYALISTAAVVTIFMGFKFGFDAFKRQLVINQLEKEKSASQLDHLKSQISPHFLFNNLNNLYSKALEGSKETPTLIHQLANMLRYMLYESKDKFVPLDKELKHLDDYIGLQKIQIEDRGTVDFQIEGHDTGDLRIAPLLLIGFIENCFKHSFSELKEKLLIEVHIRIDGQQLHLHCSNPYSAEKETVNESLPKGIGLRNVKARLNLLYPGKHRLDIFQESNIYHVNLELDLSNED